MTLKDVNDGLKMLGYPVAYSHFAEGDVPEPPFITYYTQGSDNFAADGIVYHEIQELNIELYSNEKDLAAEQKIKDFLNGKGLFYETTETYIESEEYIEVIFDVSI